MPPDTCRYTDSCADGNFGDEAWDRDAYFLANFGFTAAGTGADSWPTKTGLSTDATRAEVHQWEITHQAPPNNALDPRQVGLADEPPPKITGGGKKFTFTYTKQCQFRRPIQATGAADDPRRILPIIAANCAGLNGASDLDAFAALRVFNVFLVEASFNRTVNKGYAADRLPTKRKSMAKFSDRPSGIRRNRFPILRPQSALSHPMTRLIPVLLRSESGVAAAEMALVAPLLIVLMFASFEMGNYFLSEHAVIKQVRDGARYGSRLTLASDYTCSAGPDLSTIFESSDAAANIVNVTRTGSVDGGAAGRFPAEFWTSCPGSAAPVSVTVRCVDKDSYSGDLFDLGRQYPGNHGQR